MIRKFTSAEHVSIDNGDEDGKPRSLFFISEGSYVWDSSPQPSSFAQSIWEGLEVPCHSLLSLVIVKCVLSVTETERSDCDSVDIVSQYLKLVGSSSSAFALKF